MDWNTDRRGLLKAAGALAGLMTVPNLAWAVDGDTLRLRVDGDLQVLDPWGNLGGIDESDSPLHNRCADPFWRYPGRQPAVQLGRRKIRMDRRQDHRLHAARGACLEQGLRAGDR